MGLRMKREGGDSILEGLMMSWGRSVSKFWFIIGPLVVILLAIFEGGWSQATLSHLPFERQWSKTGGRLSQEYDYYDNYRVTPAETLVNTVTFVDKAVMGEGGPKNGVGGNVLTAEHLAEMIKTRKVFYNTRVTTKAGNTYDGMDLCDRVGSDTPGPVPAPGADPSVDGVGGTNLTGRWQEPGSSLPGFFYRGTITDQHRANAYYAFNQLRCPALLQGDLTALEEWDKKVINLGAAGLFSLNQMFGSEAPQLPPIGTGHLGLGKALMSLPDLCSALPVGLDIGDGLNIANGFPGAKTPCRILSMLDCFQETLSTIDPVFRNFVDPRLYPRSTGPDMPTAFAATLGPASPSGYTGKPAFTGKSSVQLGSIISELKWPRYANRTEIPPTALHSMAFLAAFGFPRFGTPLVQMADCPADQVAVWKAAACSWTTNVDGCRIRNQSDGNRTLPAQDFARGVLDPYILTPEFQESIRTYECVQRAPVAKVLEGCQYWATIATWEPFQMFGQTFTRGATGAIDSVPFALEAYYMGSPLSIVSRRARTHPLTSLTDVTEALDLFSLKYEDNILEQEYEKIYTSPATDGYLDRANEELEEVPAVAIIVGLILVTGLVTIFSIRPFKSLYTRTEALLSCLMVVLLSLSASLGLFGWAGIEFNPTMLSVIPLLGLAIGIDDCFILTQYFDKLGLEAIDTMELDEIVANIMKSGGSSVTLTSWCNIVAFALGYVITVPGLADFCAAASIVAAVDWLCMMTLVPIILRSEAMRIKGRKLIMPPSPCSPFSCISLFWSPKVTSPKALEPPATTWESLFVSGLVKLYAVLSTPPAIVLIASSSIAAFIIALNYSEIDPQMLSGFLPEDVAKINSPAQIYLRGQFEHYDSIPLSMHMKDIDYPHQQKEIVELIANLLDLDFIDTFPTLSWLQLFAQYVFYAGDGRLGLRNSDVFDSQCFAPNATFKTAECNGDEPAGVICCTVGCPAGLVPDFNSETFLFKSAPSATSCNPLPNPYYCPMNTSYTHPTLLPYGMVNSKCFYGLLSLFQSEEMNLNNPAILPFFPPHSKPGNIRSPFAAIGQQIGVNSIRKLDNTSRFYITPTGDPTFDTGYTCPPEDKRFIGKGCTYYLQSPFFDGRVDNPIVFSTWPLYMGNTRGAIGSDEQVVMVKTVRAIIEARNMSGKIFPQNSAFTYSEVHIDLKDIWRRTFGIDIAVICVISTIFLQSVIAGVMTAGACAFIVIEIYACLSNILYFNMITVACLLMAVGISVEFTAHLVASYTRETHGLVGPRKKIQHALQIVGPPFLLGAFSTFLGNVPLAFSESTYVSMYFFTAFAVLVAVGLANAFFFLPGKLMFTTLVADALGFGEKEAPEVSTPQYTSTVVASVSTTSSAATATITDDTAEKV